MRLIIRIFHMQKYFSIDFSINDLVISQTEFPPAHCVTYVVHGMAYGAGGRPLMNHRYQAYW